MNVKGESGVESSCYRCGPLTLLYKLHNCRNADSFTVSPGEKPHRGTPSLGGKKTTLDVSIIFSAAVKKFANEEF